MNRHDPSNWDDQLISKIDRMDPVVEHQTRLELAERHEVNPLQIEDRAVREYLYYNKS